MEKIILFEFENDNDKTWSENFEGMSEIDINNYIYMQGFNGTIKDLCPNYQEYKYLILSLNYNMIIGGKLK